MAGKIPGPGRWETLRGLLPVPFRRFPRFLETTVERYGNVVSFSLPWRTYVFVNEPALIKEVLVTQQQAFSKSLGTRVLRLLLGEGLLTSEDPLHRTMRRIVQPAFHRERIAEYVRIMERDAAQFAQRLAPEAAFDAHAAMTELTLRIATETLFGSDESDAATVVADALRLMMNEFPAMLTPLGALRQRLPLRSTQRFWRARRTLDAIIYGLIARRRRDGEERPDALSLLLAGLDDEDGNCHPERSRRIRDEIMTLFIAGHETTANLLTWSLYLLAGDGGIQERAAAAAHRGDGEYLHRVLKEALRLYPPAWIVGREALRDVTFADGTFVAAGTTLFLAPLMLHRRADYFPQPQRFDPDRWLGPEPPPFAYVPFGGGARRCIGEEFAIREAAIVLQALISRFRFGRVPGTQVEVAPLVTLRPAGPVMLYAHRRFDASPEERIREVTIGEPAVLDGQVVLADYDLRWPALFEEQAVKIRGALGDAARAIEHVGSTAVPGLAAKPFVDVCLEVADASKEAAYVPALESAGYALRIRESDWHEHRMLEAAEGGVRLHVFSEGCTEVRRMVAFRDRLRESDDDRQAYERAKRALARRRWKYVQDYADAKSAIVEEILARAGLG